MSPLVSQGIDLVIYGMGTVFVFLTLLVFATMAMSRLVLWMTPAESVKPGSPPDTRKLAAITAAVHAHRSRDQ